MYYVVCFKIVINVEWPKYIFFTCSLMMCYYRIGSLMFVDLYIRGLYKKYWTFGRQKYNYLF